MTRKRRIFDIDMPVPEPDPDNVVQDARSPAQAVTARRGPMASAISENADALSARAEAEARIRAENDALAHEYVALKRAGLAVRMVPLDAVVTGVLVRDRKAGPDPELAELVTSIREVGLSNPIRVEEREDGRFELIQGWRRLSAYRQLRAEAGEDWAEIPAGILPRGEGVAGLYRRMVDENLVRKDLSFAEMAQAARAYADDPNTDTADLDQAVRDLFRSAGYQKRSYIRAFARLLDHLGPDLRHPEAIPRKLGLDLLKLLEEHPDAAAALRLALADLPGAEPEDEIAALRAALEPEKAAEKPQAEPRKTAVKGQGGRHPKTTFDIAHPAGHVRCTAGVGQLMLKIDRDLTAVDRRRLEQAIERFLDALD